MRKSVPLICQIPPEREIWLFQREVVDYWTIFFCSPSMTDVTLVAQLFKTKGAFTSQIANSKFQI